jgi:hypothetical protein
MKGFRLALLVYLVTSCGLDTVGVEPPARPCVFDQKESSFDQPSCHFAP